MFLSSVYNMDHNSNINIGNKFFENVAKFKYLEQHL
jgi:hypothetical protein